MGCGFVTNLDVESIKSAAAQAGAEVEVVVRITISSYVVFGQPLAEWKALAPAPITTASSRVPPARRGTCRSMAGFPIRPESPGATPADRVRRLPPGPVRNRHREC